MINIKDLSLSLDGDLILDGVSLDISENRCYVIIGRNGSGKTSLFNAISNLYGNKASGDVIIDGRNVREYGIKELAGVVSYSFQMKPNVNIMVYELLRMAKYSKNGIFNRLDESDLRDIDSAVEITGIKDLLDRSVTTLSGGERQMVYIAMNIIQDSKYIILDEPTTYLDIENRRRIYDIINRLKTLGKTLMVSLHDINDIFLIADMVVVVEQGRILCNLSVDEAMKQNVIEKHFNVKRYEDFGVVFYR